MKGKNVGNTQPQKQQAIPGSLAAAAAKVREGQPPLRQHEYEKRRYLPTLAELIDRLCIVQLKEIFIPEHAEAYRKERDDVTHDIDILLKERQIASLDPIDARDVHAIVVLAIANRFIWENESKARAGGPEQDKLLKLTHSVNGVRNTAKNLISESSGERLDRKLDCLAADIPPEYGNWKIF